MTSLMPVPATRAIRPTSPSLPTTTQVGEVLQRELTAERVQAHFGHLTPGPVRRYELPQLRALNFVIENALGGGVTRSLAIDPHGKSLSALMLTITLPGHNESAA